MNINQLLPNQDKQPNIGIANSCVQLLIHSINQFPNFRISKLAYQLKSLLLTLLLATIVNFTFALTDQELIDYINSNPPNGQLKNTLISESPLSDAVMLVYINSGNWGNGNIKQVLQDNVPLSPSVADAVFSLLPSLPNGVINQVVSSHQNAGGAVFFFSIQNGNFNNVATWSNLGHSGSPASSSPSAGDWVFIKGHNITVNSTENAASIFINGINQNLNTGSSGSGNTTNSKLTLKNSANLTITENIVLDANFSETKLSLTLKNQAQLAVNGNMESKHNGGIENNTIQLKDNSITTIGGDLLLNTDDGDGKNELTISGSAQLMVSGNIQANKTGGTGNIGLVARDNAIINADNYIANNTANQEAISATLNDAAQFNITRDINLAKNGNGNQNDAFTIKNSAVLTVGNNLTMQSIGTDATNLNFVVKDNAQATINGTANLDNQNTQSLLLLKAGGEAKLTLKQDVIIGSTAENKIISNDKTIVTIEGNINSSTPNSIGDYRINVNDSSFFHVLQNVTINKANDTTGVIVVKNAAKLHVDGNYSINNSSSFGGIRTVIKDAGELKVGGNTTLSLSNGTENSKLIARNNGKIELLGDVTINSSGTTSSDLSVIVNNDATATIAGDINVTNTNSNNQAEITLKDNGALTLLGNLNYNSSQLNDIRLSIRNNANFFLHQNINRIAGELSVNMPTAQNGELYLVGTQAQTLQANIAVNNFVVNNLNGITLADQLTINGNLQFVEGILTTTTLPLILSNNATSSGAGQTSYVDGSIIKNGSAAFTYPVGDNNVFAPVTLSTSTNNNAQFQVQYFFESQTFGAAKAITLENISDCEYWTIDRLNNTAEVNVTLPWSANSCNVTDSSLTRVARWDGSIWVDEGNTTVTGNTLAGTVTSNTITAFSPFTIARTFAPLVITVDTIIDVSCNGGNTGEIQLTTTGGVPPLTYSWSTGATTEDLIGVAAGNYTITVTENDGNSIQQNFEITQHIDLLVDCEIIDESCEGFDDGSIQTIIIGGVPPYTYEWSNGATAASIFNLTGGAAYTVTITDSKNCEDIKSFEVKTKGLSEQLTLKNKGMNITLNAFSTITAEANISNTDGGIFNNKGKIVIDGDLINTSSNEMFSADTGKVIATVQHMQSVKGQKIRLENLALSGEQDTLITFFAPVDIYGDLNLAGGKLKTTRENLLTLKPGAQITNASATSFIEGPLAKEGNTAFTFPIGKDGFYHPLSISAPNQIIDVIIAEYFNAPQQEGAALSADLTDVSNCEYWTLEQLSGNSDLQIGLGWASNSCPITDQLETVVSVWTGNIWDNLGNSDVIGSPIEGFVKASSLAIAGNLPNPFLLTLGNSEEEDLSDEITYATLSKMVNDRLYEVEGSSLLFRYRENYQDLDGLLDFNIYSNSAELPVLSSNDLSLSGIEYGVNRLALDVSSLSKGTYLLEVITPKREKLYLKFKV